MNRKPSGLFLSKAVEGFGQFKRAEGLSTRTVDGYLRDLEKWIEYQGDGEIAKVKKERLRDYLTYMITEYEPQRITGNNEIKLSPKTVRNIYITLCSFFHWVSDEFAIPNPMKGVPAPKYKEPPVEPFTKDEIEALLKACDYCKEAKTDQRHKFTMRRATGYRDRAIILTLLDSGLRASELCSLKVGDLDPKTGKLTVKHGATGGAKGGKGRTVFLGKVARKAVWRYLTDREDGQDPKAPLFIGKFGRPFNRDALRQIIKSLGDKAEVKKTYPHRFRHTMAITYLRSGGDLFTLQALLGHSTLDVVKIYARVAEVDVERVHAMASPADNWRL